MALQEMRSAAVLYEKANSAHSAAREMVYLAEQGLCKLCEERQATEGTSGVPLDPAWQEMLNHATSRVNQSEAERGRAGVRHRLTTERHRSAQQITRQLQQQLKRHITKSRPYFEEKARYNASLDAQKTKIQTLEKDVAQAKLTYSQALRNLEQISDEIHKYRTTQMQEEASDTKGSPTSPTGKQKEVKAGKPVEELVSPVIKKDVALSKADSIREWIKQNGASKAVSIQDDNINGATGEYRRQNSNDKSNVVRPKSLPQDFSDKYSDILTPFQQNAPSKISFAHQNKGSESTPSTVSKNGPESDNWIEINLEYSSPEEISFEKCSNFSGLDCYRNIPYERIQGEEENVDERTSKDISPVETNDKAMNGKAVEGESANSDSKQIPNSKGHIDSPRRIIRNRLVSQKSLPVNSVKEGLVLETANGTNNAGSSVKTKLKPDISTWISRSSAKEEDAQFSPTRRQSLDVLLNDTGEKMKEIFSQGFSMFHISSLTERRGSEPRGPNTEKISPTQSTADSQTSEAFGRAIAGRSSLRKIPSPLDKTLSYLHVCNENGSMSGANSDDQGSDTDSLASVEMLTDDQIHSLMLDNHLEAVCQQLLGSSNNAKFDDNFVQ